MTTPVFLRQNPFAPYAKLALALVLIGAALCVTFSGDVMASEANSPSAKDSDNKEALLAEIVQLKHDESEALKVMADFEDIQQGRNANLRYQQAQAKEKEITRRLQDLSPEASHQTLPYANEQNLDKRYDSPPPIGTAPDADVLAAPVSTGAQ